MKKLILITGIIVYVLFAVSAFLDNGQSVKVSPNAEITVTEPSVPDVTEKVAYVVKSREGRIVVEDGATGELLTKTETLVFVLPESDREQLKEGIEAENEQEVRSILEDLCS